VLNSEVFEKLGHDPMEEDPKATAAAFLKPIPIRPAPFPPSADPPENDRLAGGH
jgi:hypothetical protein